MIKFRWLVHKSKFYVWKKITGYFALPLKIDVKLPWREVCCPNVDRLNTSSLLELTMRQMTTFYFRRENSCAKPLFLPFSPASSSVQFHTSAYFEHTTNLLSSESKYVYILNRAPPSVVSMCHQNYSFRA